MNHSHRQNGLSRLLYLFTIALVLSVFVSQLYLPTFAQAESARSTTSESLDWQQLKDGLGWLLALLSTVTLAYVTLLKKWIEKRLEDIGDWLYKRLSGTRLLRNFSLRKYRAALAQNYSMLTMPFLQNQVPLKMEDVYVPLKIAYLNRELQYTSSNGNENRQELIDAHRAINKYNRLVIVGRPGSGKSVFLKNLAWSYGSGKLNFLTGRPTIVLLELYRISTPNLGENELIENLVEVFSRNQFPNAEKLVSQSLESGSLMLLLDGLDEINSEFQGKAVQVIRDFLEKYSKCKAIITCRTAIYNNQFFGISDQTLEVVEFTDQQMQQLLKAWEPRMPRGKKSIDQMINSLRQRPIILRMTRNPLLLTLVAYLYTEPGFVLPRSRANFFKKSTDILLEQQKYKGNQEFQHNRFEEPDKRRILEHLAIYIQDHGNELKDHRSLDTRTVRHEVKAFLRSLDIPEKENRAILDEIDQRSGLFVKIDAGERYLFPHQTIQEYFAAAALIGKEEELIERFMKNPQAWQEVVKLWCNIAQDSTSLIQAVYQHDQVLGFECLAEAKKVDKDFASEVIDFFKNKIDEPKVDETLARAFGAVAASSTKDRQRGRNVFGFLKETLQDSKASHFRRVFAADALSRTNLQQAAEALVEHYETLKGWDRGRESIVRMGDLAVTGLAQLADKEEDLQTLQDLYTIGTPDAAVSLVDFLWHERRDINIHAAWYLTALLPRVDIEEELKNYTKLSFEQKQDSSIYTGVWKPFEESSESALSTITGRICYILKQRHHGLSPNFKDTNLRLDPRLIVPICTIYLRPISLPESFPRDAEALLEQPLDNPEIMKKCQEKVEHLLGSISDSDQQWKSLLIRLSPKMQLDIIKRLINLKFAKIKPEELMNHWQNLSHKIDFEFKNSFYYKVNLILAFLLSFLAITKLMLEAFNNYQNVSILSSSDFICTIIIVFLLSLHRSRCQDSLTSNYFQPNPDFFKELGPLGFMTYFRQIHQAVGNNLSWSGIKTIYNALTLTGNALIFMIVFSTVGVFLVVGVGASDNDLAIALAVISTLVVTFTFAVSGAGIITGSFDIAFTVSVIGAFTFAVALAYAIAGDISSIVPGALIGAFVGALTGAALGAWHELQLTPEKKRLKFLAVFAFPWFLWFPNILIINTWTIYDILSTYKLSFLGAENLLYKAIFAMLIIVGLGGIFWWIGYRQEVKARNPFYGGELEKILFK